MGRVGRECEVARPTSPVVRAAAKRRESKARENAGGGGGTNDLKPAPDEVFDVGEVAALFKVGERVVWQLVADGKLDTFYVGDRLRISRVAIDTFMANGGAPSSRQLARAQKRAS